MTQRAEGSAQRAGAVRLLVEALGAPAVDGLPAPVDEDPTSRAEGAVRLETRQLSVHFGER